MGPENSVNVELEAMVVLDFSLILTSAGVELAEDRFASMGESERERGYVGVGRGSTESLGWYLAFGDTNFSSLYTSDLTNRTLPLNVLLEHKIKLKPATKLKTS